jgi:hypothetical protein
MTLAEIRRLVTNYSGRTDPDFLTNVDDFIRLGHRYVERAWVGREQHYTTWGSQVPLTAGSFMIPLPAQYRPSAQLYVYTRPAEGPVYGPLTELLRVPHTAMAHPDPWRLPDGTVMNLTDLETRGEPRVYAVYGRLLQVRPLAATAKAVWISGLAWAMPLTYDTDETVVSQECPETILYAALREAWSFLGDPAQKATWEAEATRAIEAWMRDGTQQETAAPGLPLVMQTPG